MQRRLADALRAATPSSGWDRWRDAREHAHRLPKIRTYLMRALPSVPVDKRRQFVLDVFAPLLPSVELVDELLAEAVE